MKTHRAKKSLGQNFLIDPNITAKIVEAASIPRDARVLEIGPGKGALTRILIGVCKQVIGWELDGYLARSLKEEFPELALVIGDGRMIPFSRLAVAGITHVLGNLPYNIASPLLWDFSQGSQGKVHGVFMVQREVAERINAKPGTKDFGALTIWIQSFMKPTICFHVSPHVFTPKPKVWSSVIKLTPKQPTLSDQQLTTLSWLIKTCFQQRRKQLGTILKSKWDEKIESILMVEGFTHRVRPESIPVHLFHTLASYLAKTSIIA